MKENEMSNLSDIQKSDTQFYADRTQNLFDGNVTDGYALDSSTGELKTSPTYRTTGFIEVEPNTTYTHYKFMKVCFYTEDRSFIQTIGGNGSPKIFTTSSNCRLLRLCTELTSREQMLLQGAHTAFYYEPYSLTINRGDVQQERWRSKTYFADRLTGYFQAEEQSAWNPAIRTVEDIYGIYDSLVSENGDYITKTLLGKDATGSYDIYKYTFKPAYPNASHYRRHLPKILLFFGVHGMERWSIYAVAQLMKAVCENTTDPVLEYFRYNCEFVVVPLVSPWGYINGKRWNGNGVNLNRNFDYEWSVSGSVPFSGDYEGTAPFSEAESLIVRNVLDENLDAFACIDCHTHDTTNWGDVFWHVPCSEADCYEDMDAVAKNNICQMTRKMKSEYGLNYNGFIGRVEYGNGAYLTPYASAVCGLNAITGECTDKLPSEPASGSALTNRANVEFYGNLIANMIKFYK